MAAFKESSYLQLELHSESDYVKLELELAELLGWSNFHVAENSIFGTKTFGTPPYENFNFDMYGTRCTMPQWCRDWFACGQLILKHQISILHDQKGSAVVKHVHPTAGFEIVTSAELEHYESPDHALRTTIVVAVIEKLKSLQKKEVANEIQQ